MTYDYAAADAADELSKIAHELRIANLLAYHATLDAKSPQAKELLKAVRHMIGSAK